MISRLPLTAAARSSSRRLITTTTCTPLSSQPCSFNHSPPQQHQHRQSPRRCTAAHPVRTLASSYSSGPSMPEHKYGTPASPKVEDVFQKILNLDMFEVHLVTELLAERLGMNVNQAALARGAGAGSGSGGGEAKEEAKVEEKTAFDVKLTGFDAKAKIKVIKEVRSIAGLGLKEAKEMVEGAPKTVMKDIKKEEAEAIKAKLEELGATVEIV